MKMFLQEMTNGTLGWLASWWRTNGTLMNYNEGELRQRMSIHVYMMDVLCLEANGIEVRFNEPYQFH